MGPPNNGTSVFQSVNIYLQYIKKEDTMYRGLHVGLDLINCVCFFDFSPQTKQPLPCRAIIAGQWVGPKTRDSTCL